jgi:hypothetical protein
MVTICQKSTGYRVRVRWGSVCSGSLTSTDRITKRLNPHRTENTLHASRNTNDWLIKQWWRTGASFVLKSSSIQCDHHKVEWEDAVCLCGCVLKTSVIYQLLISHPSPWSYPLCSYKMYNAFHIIFLTACFCVHYELCARVSLSKLNRISTKFSIEPEEQICFYFRSG